MASSNSEISTSENEEGSGELFADLPVKSKRAQAAAGTPPSAAPKSQVTSAAGLVAPPSGQGRPVMQSSSGVHSLASAPPPPPSRVSAPPPVPSSTAPSQTAVSMSAPPPPSLRGAAPPPSAPPPPTRSEIEAAPLEHVEYMEEQGDEATPVRTPVEGTPTVKLPDVSIVAAMTRGGSSAAPPPPPTPAPVSVPPPAASMPVPSVAPPMSAPPTSVPPAPPPVSTMPVLSQPVVVHQMPAASGNNKLIVGALILLALVAAGLVYQQFAGAGAKEGTLLANVSGPGGTAVDKFELFVDGSRRCEASPCKVDGLSAGEHFVKVVAPGFESSAAVSVNIEGGKTRTHSVDLTVDKSAKPADAPAKADTKTDSKADSAKEDSAKEDTLSVDQLGDKPAEKADTKATAKADTKTAVKGAAAAKGTAKADDKGAAASNEQGTIHISSTPPSNVVVDGKPIGMTPKSVKVAPGPHTVVFIGPDGRKVQGVNVKPGGTHSASVTF